MFIYFNFLPEEHAVLSNLYFCYTRDFKVARYFLRKPARIQAFSSALAGPCFASSATTRTLMCTHWYTRHNMPLSFIVLVVLEWAARNWNGQCHEGEAFFQG